MMVATRFANFSNISTPADLFVHSNDLTNDYFGVVFLFMIGTLIFIATKNYPTLQSMSFACFAMLIVSVIMSSFGALNPGIITLVAVATMVSVGAMYWKKD